MYENDVVYMKKAFGWLVEDVNRKDVAVDDTCCAGKH